jgi:hypothetical protein
LPGQHFKLLHAYDLHVLLSACFGSDPVRDRPAACKRILVVPEGYGQGLVVLAEEIIDPFCTLTVPSEGAPVLSGWGR